VSVKKNNPKTYNMENLVKAIDLSKSINSKSEEFKIISHDLQGNILSPHGRDNAAQIFIRFQNPFKAKKFIKDYLIRRITSAADQKKDSIDFKKGKSNGFRTFLNFSISSEGYRFLEIKESKTPQSISFKEGMKKRTSRLNDPPHLNWQPDYQKDWHAIIVVSNKSSKILKSRIRNIKKALSGYIAQDIFIEIGKGIRNKYGSHIEHFGYVDGISQPHMLTDKIDEGEVSKHNWDPSGKLNLALIKDPGGESENSFGSYFVFRKLEQNVRAFRKAEKELATKIGVSEAYAGAQMVGRYRNGTPLIPISPPQPTSSGKMNDFNYSDDGIGSKCPFTSHIRKTNPRGTRISSPQFPRRGITFGGKLTNDAKSGVGLLFMAYNSHIENQFEFMQSSWANNIGFPRTNTGIDPIIGQGSVNSGQTYFSKWGNESSNIRQNPSLGNFVTMNGGEYFFTPSISFLKNLQA